MVDVLSQPEDVPTRPVPLMESLNETLDNLLERYLNLLHEYQSLQQSLAKDFSSGYISLAQANFSNPNRVRYGQDFYDERMQAATLCNVSSASGTSSGPDAVGFPMKNSISVATLPVISKNLGSKQAKKDENPAPVQTDSGPTPPISDSLRWFGILVPPALRACQSSFRHAVTETVPALAEVADEMKSLEIEIRRTRKKIRKAG